MSRHCTSEMLKFSFQLGQPYLWNRVTESSCVVMLQRKENMNGLLDTYPRVKSNKKFHSIIETILMNERSIFIYYIHDTDCISDSIIYPPFCLCFGVNRGFSKMIT